VDADLIAREMTAPGGAVLGEIVAAFGQEVVDAQGNLQRKALADLIFSDPEARERLNRITHPAIVRELKSRIQKLTESPQGPPVVVAVVPLLIEAGLQHLVDQVIVVYATQEEQIRRLKERDGLTEQEALQRINSQMSLSEKMKHGDWVIDTSLGAVETERAVEEIWQEVSGA